MKYLGHVVSSDGVATDPEKVEAVGDWPVPKDLSELRFFLGTVGYYRRYVESFATIAKPLFKLTAKSVRFEWTGECRFAFDSLNQVMMCSNTRKTKRIESLL